MKIEFAGQELLLLAPGGVYWQELGTLFVADLHFGKAASFRALSVPAPCGTTRETLEKLDRLLDETGARRLVVLGDLWHSRDGRHPSTVAQVMDWRRRQRLEVMLVRGNHDQRSGPLESEFGYEVEEGFQMPPFELFHNPALAGLGGFALAGHIHPAVRMVGKGEQSLTAACFWIRKHCIVLPALGAFTGRHTVRVKTGERVVAIWGEHAVEPRTVSC